MKASESLGTRESPDYNVLGSETFTAVSIAGVLFALTIASMLKFSDTFLGEAVMALYAFLPILGMVVVGGLLTLGYVVTNSGIENDSTGVALFGSLITVFSYGAFGAAILTPYSSELYNQAIAVSAGVTGIISLISAIVVYSTDRSFKSWGAKSGKLFIFALIFVALGSFIPGPIGSFALAAGFFLVIIGFVVDLVYEIWQVSSGYRTPVQNGFGLYVAFTGVFVHILQLVIESMAGQD
jgi:FtsH-binding integral membrane protein